MKGRKSVLPRWVWERGPVDDNKNTRLAGSKFLLGIMHLRLAHKI